MSCTRTPSEPPIEKDTMELDDLLRALNDGQTITGNSPLHGIMHRVSQDALGITSELNSGYREPARVRELLAQLDRQVGEEGLGADIHESD